MSERIKLLKKAVLTGVGASTSVERIKGALGDAMQDLVKVGHDLLDELEVKGKSRTESVQEFLKHLQSEATKKTHNVEKTVSTKVQTEFKKAIKEFGLITRDDFEEIAERLNEIEIALGVSPEEHTDGKRGRRKKTNHHESN